MRIQKKTDLMRVKGQALEHVFTHPEFPPGSTAPGHSLQYRENKESKKSICTERLLFIFIFIIKGASVLIVVIQSINKHLGGPTV